MSPSEHEMVQRFPQHVAAVRRFFAQFYGPELPEFVDVDNDALLLQIGPERYVSIRSEFFDEYGADEVFEKLTGWNIAHLSRTLPAGATLEVTAFGPEALP